MLEENHRKWTKEEENFMEEMWGTISIKAIAKNLGRSEKAVEVKKNKMQLGPFIESGDYITFGTLLKALGLETEYAYKKKLWIEKKKLPVHKKTVKENTFRIIKIEEWWEWAEKNKGIIDFSRMEENILGIEPEWVKRKRKRDRDHRIKYTTKPWTGIEDVKLRRMLQKKEYTYKQISKELKRTIGSVQKRIRTLEIDEKPIKAKIIAWTEDEVKELEEMIEEGCTHEYMAEKLGRSAKAIRGKIYQKYKTESIDKARERIKTKKDEMQI